MDEQKLDLKGCLETAACHGDAMPWRLPLVVSSPAFLRNAVLIPGGLGLSPGLTADVG